MTAKKLGLKQRYAHMTRGLDWETSYQPMDKVFPYDQFEGIKIKDWAAWEDPFRLTMDSYWKFQAEKERKLYAVIDAFAQNNGQAGVSDGRYINVLKLFLNGVSPLEYQAHRGFAFTGRHLRGVGPRVAAQMQSLDELRHVQTQIHTMSHYNKYFNGLSEFPTMHDRVFYLSVPKSFFDDARTSGPFEFMIAIGFAFEYLLTNLLFVPFMSGAAYNGDMSTVTFGFSAQSDESRHMTLGIEVIKFLLEQHPDNLPIVQKWVDKWFWRGFRVLGLVAMMMDYMLPKPVMSWKEAWEIYFVEAGGALFQDLGRYGLKMPKYHDVATEASEHVGHQLYSLLYQLSHVAGIHAWMPSKEHLDWLSEKYPNTFDKYYRPRWEMWAAMEKEGKRFYYNGLLQLCHTCQLPMTFTEPGDPTTRAFRETEFRGQRFHFCSDGCKDIFEAEPEKYIQSWLPIEQIFQGNCGGPTVPDVLNWYKIKAGVDNGEYVGSEDHKLWDSWKQNATVSKAC
jgi:phenol/toluene 2-monooxygenase (NADH) P3/A3